MFHVCLNFGVVYGVGACVNVCGVVCVVVIFVLYVMRVVGGVPWVECVLSVVC